MGIRDMPWSPVSRVHVLCSGWLDFLRRSRWGFEWRYLRGKTPWDTNITPPEVMEFIGQHAPGRALDLGCGTGTNAITLARRGWDVTGVDFSGKAIRKAADKAKAAGLEIRFIQADVTDLSMLRDPYDYVLDIGCLSGMAPEARGKYASQLVRLLKPGGWYMLYAWLPRQWRGSTWGISPEEVEALLGPALVKVREVIGEERGFASAWYWFRKF